LVRDQEAVGSTPATPTIKIAGLQFGHPAIFIFAPP
jgi:hypothetical protein